MKSNGAWKLDMTIELGSMAGSTQSHASSGVEVSKRRKERLLPFGTSGSSCDALCYLQAM